MENLKKYIKISLKNKARIEKATVVGCYNCLSFLDKESLNYYEERDGQETATCPKCSLDSIIDNVSVEAEGDVLNIELLQRINKATFRLEEN